MRTKVVKFPDGSLQTVPRSAVQDLIRQSRGRWFSGRPDVRSAVVDDADIQTREADVERDWAEDTEIAP